MPGFYVTTESTSHTTIHELERFFQDSGIPFTLLVERGEVRETLDRVSEDYAIDLIILGSPRPAWDFLFVYGVHFGECGRSSTRPVITVGPKVCANFENSFKTILWATDFSEESKLALPFATLLAQEFHANLTVFHVAPKIEIPVRDQAGLEAYLMNKLNRLAPQSRCPWCTVNHAVAFGDASEEILEAAKRWKADLIVLGLHSSVRFTSHLPERLSYRVLCDAPCPVLSVLPNSQNLKLGRLPAGMFGDGASQGLTK